MKKLIDIINTDDAQNVLGHEHEYIKTGKNEYQCKVCKRRIKRIKK